MKNKYYQVIKDLDSSNFKPLPMKRLDADINAQQIHDNLWSMFTKPADPDTLRTVIEDCEDNGTALPLGYSISDYALSESALEMFNRHPFHRKFMEELKEHGSTINRKFSMWWCLSAAPSMLPDEVIDSFFSPESEKSDASDN